jgi:flavin-dependent dehydrogenase
MLPASETLQAGCPPDHLRFSMIPGTGSYSWAFPHGGKVCEGSVGKGHGSGRYIPFGGVGEISRGNVLLLGDAAGMPNPVSFAGLRAALVSGRKAAEAIIENDVLAYAKWWNRSVLSDARFMEFHRRLTDMGEDEIAELFRPFSNGHVYISGLGCIICHPENRIMYFGCLQAFRHSW